MVIPQINQKLKGKLITFPIFMLIIYIVCTYSPVIYMYSPVLGKIRIVLLTGIALVITFILSGKNYMNKNIYRNPILFVWLGFLVVMVISLVVSYDRGLTLKMIEANVKYFIVFLVMIKIIDSDKRLDLILGVFVACGVVMAINTNINYFFLGKTFQDSYRGIALEAGIFGDPNDLAMLFNVTLPVMLYFLIKNKKKLLLLAGISLLVMAIMLTYSRGGFFGLCTVGFGFLFLMGRKKISYVFLVIFIGVLFWNLAPEDYKKRISTIKEEVKVDEETGKYPGRMEAWKVVLKEAMNCPILGAGAGCSHYVAGSSMGDWHLIHNSFIQIFIEMGILGLIPFLLFFILPYRQYRAFLRHSAEGLKAHLARFRFLLLSLAGFATTAFFLPQAYSPILYFLSGLGLVQVELTSRFKESLELPHSKLN